jgi:hypothetical protein
MTVQSRDILIFEDEEYRIDNLPLNSYLVEKDIKFVCATTNLGRGYFATWELKEGALFLIDFHGFVENYARVEFDYLFPGENKVFASWFSGCIKASTGVLLQSDRLKNIYIYEFDLYLTFENGKIKRQWLVDNKDLNERTIKCLKYEGESKNGKRHGYGIFTGKNGFKYEGEFKNNKFHGRGKIHYCLGTVYEGEFKNNLAHGTGICYLFSGEIRKGIFVKGKLNGDGEVIINSKTIYIGKFKNDKFHGFGKKYFQKGAFYEGSFQNGQIHGFGVFNYSDGRKYEGYYKHNKTNGKGNFYYVKPLVYDFYFFDENKSIKTKSLDIIKIEGKSINDKAYKGKFYTVNGEVYYCKLKMNKYYIIKQLI